MSIRTTMMSEDDIQITTMDTPHGYHDYCNSETGKTYRIAIDNEPTDDHDEWLSISLDPMVYPLEQVTMEYQL